MKKVITIIIITLLLYSCKNEPQNIYFQIINPTNNISEVQRMFFKNNEWYEQRTPVMGPVEQMEYDNPSKVESKYRLINGTIEWHIHLRDNIIDSKQIIIIKDFNTQIIDLKENYKIRLIIKDNI